MSEPMRVRLRAGAPIADVWRALTNPAALRVWLAEHAEVDLPARYEFWGRYTPAGDRPRQRLIRAADHTLEFAWPIDGTDTTVRIDLEPESPRSTVITLSQTGLPGWPEMMRGAGTLGLLHTYWALSLVNLVDHVEGREPVGRCDFTSPRMRAQLAIAASPREVLDSLLDPAVFARWFGARIDVEPEIGGRWAMGGFELDESPAKILDLEPGRRLSLGWDGMVSTWELAESEGRTRLTFVQSGFDDTNPPYGAWMGWLSGFAELRRYHAMADWRPMWIDVHVEGIPEGMLTLE